jgi:hypothetical protein
MIKPFQEFSRYAEWKERFLKEQERIKKIQSEVFNVQDQRLSKAMASMYVGGLEQRLRDEEIKRWTDWAVDKTYRTFNTFPQLSDLELSFLFYCLGKLFVPLLLHEKGVKSESFKNLSEEEQENAVSEVLDTIWENHLIRILQIIPYVGLNSTTK